MLTICSSLRRTVSPRLSAFAPLARRLAGTLTRVSLATTAFGQPAQVALGKGWVQEWLARTLRQPLSEFNSTTNSTLHSSKYFPLDQKLYVDASHDTGEALSGAERRSFRKSRPDLSDPHARSQSSRQ